MATLVIHNGAFNGALSAFLEGRLQTDAVSADYATVVNAANAFATQFLTANAAASVPMADADNAQIGDLCFACCKASLAGRPYTSATATDYTAWAAAAVAVAIQGKAKLT